MVLGANKELASRHAADVVIKLELGREGGALVGGVSTTHNVQGAVVSRISSNINILKQKVQKCYFVNGDERERERERERREKERELLVRMQ